MADGINEEIVTLAAINFAVHAAGILATGLHVEQVFQFAHSDESLLYFHST